MSMENFSTNGQVYLGDIKAKTWAKSSLGFFALAQTLIVSDAVVTCSYIRLTTLVEQNDVIED